MGSLGKESFLKQLLSRSCRRIFTKGHCVMPIFSDVNKDDEDNNCMFFCVWCVFGFVGYMPSCLCVRASVWCAVCRVHACVHACLRGGRGALRVVCLELCAMRVCSV